MALLTTTVALRSDQASGPDAAVLVAARQEATNFFSLDYRHAAQDVDGVLALATGDFKDQYAARRDEVIASVTDKKLIVTATIPEDGAAVEYSDSDRAQVLVAVDVSTSTTGGEPTANRYRARIILEQVDGEWLVSGLEQVG